MENKALLFNSFLEKEPRRCIANAYCEVKNFPCGDNSLPCVLNNDTAGSTYLSSFYGQYIHYGKEQILRSQRSFKKFFLLLAIQALGGILRFCRLDETVQVNNCLLPTSLYPDLQKQDVENLSAKLLEKYPKKAIVWRSVSFELYPNLFAHLFQLGYRPLFSRPIYCLDTSHRNPRPSRHLKKDRQLWESKSYEMVSENFSKQDYERMAYLHRQLQLEKHSALNPDLTAEFLQTNHARGFLHITAVKMGGCLEGVYGTYCSGKVMTAPLFGYNTTLGSASGLYRLLTHLSIQEAAEKKMIYHMSGGAGEFKKRRGAKKIVEFHFFSTRHLPMRQRWGFAFLAWLLKRFSLQDM